jgi:hypothetical protein
MDTSSTYKSYLLRLWTATRDGEPVWHASLQNTATGQRQGFPDLESLFDYLAAPADGEKAVSDPKTKPTTGD